MKTPEDIIHFGPPVAAKKNGANANHPESNQRELRSERAMEIISSRPGFLARWGNVFFAIVLLLMVAACWFIKYPDIIQSTSKLTSINAPKPVVTYSNGKLIGLLASENQYVKQGEMLGFIESTADHQEVLKVSAYVDSIERTVNKGEIEKIQDLPILNTAQLGELQSSNQIFSQALFSFKNYLSNGFYQKKKSMVINDLESLKKIHAHLILQKSLQQEDLKLAEKTFDGNQKLKEGNVISDFDYRSEQSKLINKKLSLPQINLSIINNENQQNEKRKELMELDNATLEQHLTFQQGLLTFKSQIEDWKKKYLLIAPTDGKVAFASFFQESQQLQMNQTICYINPENTQYFAEIVVPQLNFGKVKVGQKVLLKFSSYPFQEFGFVTGNIAFISSIPNEEGYLAKVDLPNGLKTTNNQVIQYREGLIADAEIIAKDLRLLERFYYDIKKQLKY